MTVFVDDMYLHPLGRFGRMKMSHMAADTDEELYAMADKIGVARKWVQKAELGKGWIHFDVAMSARKKAIENGAVEITLREMAAMMMRWREERAKEKWS